MALPERFDLSGNEQLALVWRHNELPSDGSNNTRLQVVFRFNVHAIHVQDCAQIISQKLAGAPPGEEVRGVPYQLGWIKGEFGQDLASAVFTMPRANAPSYVQMFGVLDPKR